MPERLFTSESVTEGHPDKIADQISDAVLDRILHAEPDGRSACETLVTTGLVLVAGEIRCSTPIPVAEVARETLRSIGYLDSRWGIDAESCGVLVSLDQQSADIALGVDTGGAGDQGMMFGFATDETPERMPLPIVLAHRLTHRLAALRHDGTLPWLRPDGKAQVTVGYRDGKPDAIRTVVVSTQHDEAIEQKEIEEAIAEEVVRPILPEEYLDGGLPRMHINPTGKFVIGGPQGDAGLTGRKIIVDTYGGMGRHGGGAFSGKDATKVDRSAAYASRWAARTIVDAGLAGRCEIQLAYAIGVAEPVSIHVETFGTAQVSEEKIAGALEEVFDFRPRGIIRDLGLDRPIFGPTAAYGHFGREPEKRSLPWADGREVELFPWERSDRADLLREKLG